MKALFALGLLAGVASAQPLPDPVLAAGITERPGAQVPLATRFTLAHGGGTNLARFFDGKRPVLLVLAYARCTMLCSIVLRGVAKAAHELERDPRHDYRLVVVSLDSRETADEGARKQATLLAQLGRGDDPETWPYLLGSRESIDAVADAVGFRYAWDPRTEQYAHPAVIFALTPDGQVARYIHGIEPTAAELAGALDDAKAGRMLSTAALEILRCFHFDPSTRRYGARAQAFLRIGAAGMFVVLAGAIALLIGWERRLRRRP